MKRDALAIAQPCREVFAGRRLLCGYDGMTPADFFIPRLKIVQPASRRGTPGAFLDLASGEEFRALPAVVLRNERGRVLFDREAEAGWRCRSHDGERPGAEVADPPAVLCRKCSHARGLAGEPAPCRASYRLLLVHRERRMPYRLYLHGAQLGAVRRYQSMLFFRGLNLFDASALLRLAPRTESFGPYFELQITGLRWHGARERRRWRELYDRLAALRPPGPFGAPPPGGTAGNRRDREAETSGARVISFPAPPAPRGGR